MTTEISRRHAIFALGGVLAGVAGTKAVDFWGLPPQPLSSTTPDNTTVNILSDVTGVSFDDIHESYENLLGRQLNASERQFLGRIFPHVAHAMYASIVLPALFSFPDAQDSSWRDFSKTMFLEGVKAVDTKKGAFATLQHLNDLAHDALPQGADAATAAAYRIYPALVALSLNSADLSRRDDSRLQALFLFDTYMQQLALIGKQASVAGFVGVEIPITPDQIIDAYANNVGLANSAGDANKGVTVLNHLLDQAGKK